MDGGGFKFSNLQKQMLSSLSRLTNFAMSSPPPGCNVLEHLSAMQALSTKLRAASFQSQVGYQITYGSMLLYCSGMCMLIGECMHAYAHPHTCIHMHMHAHTHTHPRNAHAIAHIYVYKHTNTFQMHSPTHTDALIDAYTHARTHTYTHIYMHAPIHKPAYACVPACTHTQT